MNVMIDRLSQIVGSRFVSAEPEERYLYSMDQGTMPPVEPDAPPSQLLARQDASARGPACPLYVRAHKPDIYK